MMLQNNPYLLLALATTTTTVSASPLTLQVQYEAALRQQQQQQQQQLEAASSGLRQPRQLQDNGCNQVVVDMMMCLEANCADADCDGQDTSNGIAVGTDALDNCQALTNSVCSSFDFKCCPPCAAITSQWTNCLLDASVRDLCPDAKCAEDPVTSEEKPAPAEGTSPGPVPAPTKAPAPTLGPQPTLGPAPTTGPQPTLGPAPTIGPGPTLGPGPTTAPAPTTGLVPATTTPGPTVNMTTTIEEEILEDLVEEGGILGFVASLLPETPQVGDDALVACDEQMSLMTSCLLACNNAVCDSNPVAPSLEGPDETVMQTCAEYSMELCDAFMKVDECCPACQSATSTFLTCVTTNSPLATRCQNIQCNTVTTSRGFFDKEPETKEGTKEETSKQEQAATTTSGAVSTTTYAGLAGAGMVMVVTNMHWM